MSASPGPANGSGRESPTAAAAAEDTTEEEAPSLYDQDEMNGQATGAADDSQQQQRDSLPDLGPSNEQNRPQPAKTVYFHRDGVQYKEPVRVAIHPNRYRGIDSLLTDLTDRMPELSHGVRAVFTPKGRDRVGSVDDFANQGHYVCSTSQRRAAPVEPGQPGRAGPAWKGGGGKLRNSTAPDPVRPRPPPPRRDGNASNSKSYPGSEPDDASPAPYAPTFRPADCKRIYVRKNGEPFKKHIVLLNKRSVRDYEQVLDDLSGIFQMQVRRLFTVDGEPVESLSAIYNGPENYVAAGAEKFKPVYAWNGAGGGGGGDGGAKSKAAPIGRRSKEQRANAGKSKGQWRVRVSTQPGPEEHGTSSRVFITVYGRQGSSEPIPLSMPIQTDCIVDPFRPGQEDEFEINAGPVGDVMKVRLSHDSSGPSPDWCVGQLSMTDAHTGEQLTFDFNCWLSDARPGCEPSRELPAVREGARPLPIEKYTITVSTGSRYNAGTDGRVSVVLFGDYGDTGPRQLVEAAAAGPPLPPNPPLPPQPPPADEGGQQRRFFQMGQTDTFELEAVYLGKIKKISIGHDSKGAGYGWYLDSVVVTAASKPDAPVTFPCHRWLDEGEDDGKTTRELRPQESQADDHAEKLAWRGFIWLFQADTVIQLYSRLTGKPLRINADNSVDASAAEDDPLSYFTVGGKKENVRTLRTVAGPRSFLAVEAGQIVGQAKPSPQCELRIRAQQDRSVALESSRQPLLFVGVAADGQSVDPRQWKGAPDGPGKLLVPYCKGALRDGGTVALCTSLTQALAVDHDNSVNGAGARGLMAQFRVRRPPGGFDGDDDGGGDDRDELAGVRLFESVVFPDQFLRVKDGVCDCRGSGDMHCYFRVARQKAEGTATLESVRSPGSFIGLAPDGKAIIADASAALNGDGGGDGTGESARATRFFIEVVAFGKTKSSVPPPQPPQPPPPRQQPPKQPPPPPPPQKQQQQKVKKAAEPEPQSEPPPSPPPDTGRASLTEPHEWLLLVDTEAACAGADVSLTAYGTQNSVGPILLGSAGGQAFLAATQDEFKIELKDAGQVYKLRLELKPWDPAGQPPSWSISRLVLRRPDSEVDFQAGQRAFGLGDGQDSAVEFPAPDSGLQVLEYSVLLVTGPEQAEPFQGAVWVCLFGERGDSGRRLCHTGEGAMAAGDSREFTIAAVDLGQLKHCLVSADVPAAGPGWQCDRVSVTHQAGVATYACGSWLDPDQGDGKVERLLRQDEFADSYEKELENLTEDEDMEQYREDGQLLIQFSNQTFREKLDAYAKALIDDITEQAAKRMQELHEGDSAANGETSNPPE